MAKNDTAPPGELILYASEDGRTRVQCRISGQTLWLTQAQIGELFGKDTRTVNEHLRNIVTEGELDATATIRKFRIVRREGTREVERLIDHYNLDAILAVGYRVRSSRGTQFRRWATERNVLGHARQVAHEQALRKAQGARPRTSSRDDGPSRTASRSRSTATLTRQSPTSRSRQSSVRTDVTKEVAGRDDLQRSISGNQNDFKREKIATVIGDQEMRAALDARRYDRPVLEITWDPLQILELAGDEFAYVS